MKLKTIVKDQLLETKEIQEIVFPRISPSSHVFFSYILHVLR